MLPLDSRGEAQHFYDFDLSVLPIDDNFNSLWGEAQRSHVLLVLHLLRKRFILSWFLQIETASSWHRDFRIRGVTQWDGARAPLARQVRIFVAPSRMLTTPTWPIVLKMRIKMSNANCEWGSIRDEECVAEGGHHIFPKAKCNPTSLRCTALRKSHVFENRIVFSSNALNLSRT